MLTLVSPTISHPNLALLPDCRKKFCYFRPTRRRDPAIERKSRNNVSIQRPYSILRKSFCRYPALSTRSFSEPYHSTQPKHRVIKSMYVDASSNEKFDGAKSIALNEIERTSMMLLSSNDPAEYKADLPRPVEGTCCWILGHPQYLDWIAERKPLLWVTGDPGCGKTILSSYLIQHLTTDSKFKPPSNVFFFFCDDKVGKQRDAKDILCSILHQIFQKHRKLIKYLKSRYDTNGGSLVDSFPALWAMLMRVSNETSPKSIIVIIDAIDECEERTRRVLLNHIIELAQESQSYESETQLEKPIKFFITSRPSMRVNISSDVLLSCRLSIELSPKVVKEDIKLVIRKKVQEIAGTLNISNEMKEHLEISLWNKSGQTFLWVENVIRSIQESALVSRKDFDRIINTFPNELEATYEKLLLNIQSRNMEPALKILRLLIGSSRQLSLTEINAAFSIELYHETAEDLQSDYQLSMKHMLQETVGPLLKIVNSKVSLIHQSAKEFLTDKALISQNDLIRRYNITPIEATLNIAECCIQYIMLRDFHIEKFTHDFTEDSPISPNSSHSKPIDTQVDQFPLDTFGLDDIFADTQAIFEKNSSFITENYDFWDYAAMHWAEHFAICEDIATNALQDKVYNLIKERGPVLTNWLTYLWHKSGLDHPSLLELDGIIVAAFFGFTSLIKRLLRENPSYNDSTVNQALFWASRMNHLNSVQLLLHHGADSNHRMISQDTPLTIAAKHSHFDIINLLIEQPGTKEALGGRNKRSALSYAAENGHLDIVKVLLQHQNQQPDTGDSQSWTPLIWAVSGDHVSVALEFFRNPSVNVNHVDHAGRSVFSWAAGENSLKCLTAMLKVSHVDVNLRDMKDRTPLSWAAGNGHTKMVGILMRQKHIDKSRCDQDGRNSLSWACGGGYIDTIKVILKYSLVGVDEQDNSGWSPLFWALDSGSTDMMKLLLSVDGVSIDRQDSQGRTVLSWAAAYGQLEIVQLLLSHRAKTELYDNSGRLAADWAKIHGHTGVLMVLQA
jgi:ankyrin repeat protein